MTGWGGRGGNGRGGYKNNLYKGMEHAAWFCTAFYEEQIDISFMSLDGLYNLIYLLLVSVGTLPKSYG